MPLGAAALGLCLLWAAPVRAGIELAPASKTDPATTACGKAKAPTAGESVKISACLDAVEYSSLPTARGADGEERACDFQAACRKGEAAARDRMSLELRFRDMSDRLDRMPRFPHEQDLAELNLLLAEPGLTKGRKERLGRRLTQLKEDEELRIQVRRERAAKERETAPSEALGSAGSAGRGLVFDGARQGTGDPAAGRADIDAYDDLASSLVTSDAGAESHLRRARKSPHSS